MRPSDPLWEDRALVSRVMAAVDRALAPQDVVVALSGSAASGHPAASDLDIMVFSDVSQLPLPMRHQSWGDLHVHLHLRPAGFLSHLVAANSEAVVRCSGYPSAEVLWDLRDAALLRDRNGLGRQAQLRAQQLCADADARMLRARRGLRRVSRAASRLVILAGISNPIARSSHACRLARSLFGLTDGPINSGLGATLLMAMCQAADRSTLRWRLWGEAAAAQEQLPLSRDPLEMVMMAHGLCSSEESCLAPGLPAPPPPPQQLIPAALELACSSLRTAGLTAEEATAVTGRYQRLTDSGQHGIALMLLRGAAAEWMGRDRTYLELCGALPSTGPQSHDPAAAWPALLGAVSSLMVGAQIIMDLGSTLTLLPG